MQTKENLQVMIDKARSLATKAHAQQKYGDLPYMTHIEAVVELLKPYGQDAMVAGYLHDVLEDSDTDSKEIESEFGTQIAKCLELLRDDPKESRRARKIKAYARLSRVTGAEELALIVAVADRLANLQACIKGRNVKLLKMYLKELEPFRSAVYRNGLCDELWSDLNRAAEQAATIVNQ